MKKLILCLLLVSSVCHAEEWMETVNEAGGKIFFFIPSDAQTLEQVGR